MSFGFVQISIQVWQLDSSLNSCHKQLSRYRCSLCGLFIIPYFKLCRFNVNFKYYSFFDAGIHCNFDMNWIVQLSCHRNPPLFNSGDSELIRYLWSIIQTGNGDWRGGFEPVSPLPRLRHRQIQRPGGRQDGVLDSADLHREGDRRSKKLVHHQRESWWSFFLTTFNCRVTTVKGCF